MNVIICGLGKGKVKKYSCICCGWETDDIEEMAVSMCWDCVCGTKKGCRNCESFDIKVGEWQENTGSETQPQEQYAK